jgi:hypothetical protein
MTDPADPDLDALLRRHFDAAIPDDGFSARVIAALPPRPRQRPWTLPLAAMAGTALTWASIAPAPLWNLAADAWTAGNAGTPVIVAGSLILLLAMAACGWALADTD